jgi:hypothetical protein
MNLERDDDPLAKLFEETRSSPLKDTARHGRGGRKRTPSEEKALKELKRKLFDCVREIAKVQQGEQFWIISTLDITDSFFSGA